MTDLAQAPALVRTAVDALDLAFSGDGAPTPFATQRKTARKAFESLGIPTTKHEAWKYTDLRPALKPDYQFADGTHQLDASALSGTAIEGFDAARVVIVNGSFDASLSDLSGLPESVRIGSLRAASLSQDSELATHFGRHADVERDSFTALNASFDLDGLYLHVPRGVAVERPIHVVHITTADAPTFVQSRHLMVIEDVAQATVLETFHVHGASSTFRNELTEIVAGAQAHVEHVRVQDEGDEANGVSLVQVHQERDSTVKTLVFTFASGTVRNNMVMVPSGEGCLSTLGGLYICRGEQHVDTSTLVDHVAPGCQSNELFKGIVYEKSTGVFNGKVFVRREAQQTNAYQQSQGVVLSPDAHHYSKPELEIYADDVQCSHGSTTGSVEPEHIFYLRSRGVSEADARAMLLYAFAHDVVEMVSSEPLRDHLDAMIAERLK